MGQNANLLGLPLDRLGVSLQKKSLNQAVNQLLKIGQRRPLTFNEANALVKALNAQHKLMNIAFNKARSRSFRTPRAP